MAGARIQLKRATAASWSSANPVLYAGEIGYETDTNKFKIGNGSTAYNSLAYFNGNLTGSNLNDLADVTIVSAANGDFLRWNGTAWINDAVNLSTDTVGNYMVDVAGGTGVTVTHTPGEGSTASVAIGQDVGTSASVTFAHISAPLSGNVVGNVTGDVSGNAGTATALQNARTISLGGDLSGSASFNGGSDITITAAVQPNSVTLGTDTTGNYMTDVVGGTGVTITHTPGEGSSASIAIGQAVATSSSVTFAAVTAPLIGNANTASALQNARTIQLIGDLSGSASFDGSTSIQISASVEPNSVTLGQDTVGNYMQDVVGGTGVTVTHTPGESSTASVSIGQDVSTSASVTFANLTVSGDLTVNGTTTTLNTQDLLVEDNTIVLNANVTGDPSGTAGIEIERGSLTNVQLRWNETTDSWEITEDGTTYRNIATGQDVETSSSVTFAAVTAPLIGNASTATTLATARAISLGGDLSGSASFDGSQNITITAEVQPNSVALGTDTTGNYVSSLVAGTGITLSNNSGESATPTVAIGQDVATTASVTFAAVTASLVGNASTATALQTARTIELSGDVSGSASFNGTSNINISTTVNTASVSITELGGVNITSPAEFQTLEYNGTEWVNQYSSVVSYVQNAEATTLTTGTVVYLFGGTGDHASVKRADNNSDSTSSKTVGLVGANIAASQNGPVITRGYVDGINLSVGYAPGDVLWLGENGAFTKNKPSAPDHLVFIGVVVRATNNGIVYVATQNGYELEELHDVKINGVANGDFLKYNSASAVWVNDQINLGTDTVGDYVQNLVAGTGVTLSNNSGEGSTPTIAIGQDVGTSSSVVFARVETTGHLIVGQNLYVSGSVVTENQTSLQVDDPFIYLNGSASASGIDIGIAGNINEGSSTHSGIFRDATDGKWKFFDSYTPEPSSPINTGHASYSPAPVVAETFESTIATGSAPFVVASTTEVANLHADTATTLHTARAISLGGDLSGSASFDGSGDITITASVEPNSVALGTDTTGNYMVGLAEGTGVTIIHTPGEGSTASVSIGQSVATSASVTFAHVSAPITGNVTGNVTGDVSGNAGTATTLQTSRTISLGGDLSGSASFNGSTDITITAAVQPNSVTLGTDTTGNYVSDVTAGTGVTVTHTPSEGSSPTIAIGQAVGTSASVQFAQITTTGNVTIGGDLTVNGTTTTVNTETINLADNIIVLNSNETSAPSQNAGIEVERGSATNVSIRWNESSDKWELTEDGTAYQNIATVAYVDSQSIAALDDIGDVTLTSASAGDFLKWNGSAWVNDPINLGTDTVGNYVSDVVAGNLITVTHTPGEGSSASVAVANGTAGQIIVANASGVPTWVTESGDITIDSSGVTAISSGVIVNADISTSAAIAHSKLANASAGQVLLGTTTTGVVTATTVSGDVTITGAGVTAIGSGVIVDGDISPSAKVGLSKLANITAGSILMGNASNTPTATAMSGDVTITSGGVTAIGSGVIVNADINSSAAIALSKLESGTSAQVIVANSSGVPTYTTLSGDVTISDTGVVSIAANSVALGTDTTGNYVANVSGGTGITVTHTPGEGSSASVVLNATLDDLSNVTVPSPTNGQVLTYSTASSAWIAQNGASAINALDDIGDVTITSAASGDFLKWNGSAWVNDPINLGTDTTGNYMVNVSAGDGITVTHTQSEGSTATISARDTLVRFYMEVI